MNARKGRRAEKRLVLEIEEFLRGRVRLGFVMKGSAVPAWVEINWLAHGDPSEILARAREELGLKRPQGSWVWATSTLVNELFMDAGANADTIRQLQRDCIIPMEMALMSQTHQTMLPVDLVTLGVLRLRSHPHAHRSPNDERQDRPDPFETDHE